MSRFLAGVAFASVLWGAALAYLVLVAGYAPPPSEPAIAEVEAEEPVSDATAPATARRSHRRRATTGTSDSSDPVPSGMATTGDDLGEGEMRVIDGEGSGGEEQLSGAEVEAGFDSGMGRIRRCFMLAPGDAPITGRLTFGLRIAGSGSVTAVNLSGPAALTSGECGTCLRDAARAIHFATFDGPEMVVRYPITLE